MAKVIEITPEKISIGLDDGTIKEIVPTEINFTPNVGDNVDIFESEGKTIVSQKKPELDTNTDTDKNNININVNVNNENKNNNKNNAPSFIYLQQNSAKNSSDYFAKICMVAALSTVLSTVSMLVPFAPAFYKLEISDSVILIAGFTLGPTAVAYMQLIKILLSYFISGTVTAGVGELASFLMGISLAIPATAIYQTKKTMTTAVIGLAVGTVSLAIVGGLINLFFLIPAYSKGYGLPLEVIVKMGTEKNSAITNLNELILYATIPFNILKAFINSIITLALYKKASQILSISKK